MKVGDKFHVSMPGHKARFDIEVIAFNHNDKDREIELRVYNRVMTDVRGMEYTRDETYIEVEKAWFEQEKMVITPLQTGQLSFI